MKLNAFVFVAIISLLLIFASCQQESIPVQSTDSNFNLVYDDSILFVSTRGIFDPGIFILCKDGSGIRDLKRNWFTFNPRWSPDKRKILFITDTSWGSPERGLYVMDVSSQEQKRLTPVGEDVWYGEYSPNGNQIAYIVIGETGLYKIRIMQGDGSNPKDVTTWIASMYQLSWSSTSDKLVFNGFIPSEKNATIFIVNSDGSNLHALFNFDYGCYFPSWSPDGSKIIFTSYDHGPHAQLYIYNFVSCNIYPLHWQFEDQGTASWSRTGDKLVFDARSYGENKNSCLYVINSDGSGLQKITNGTSDDRNPCWYK